MKFHTKDCQQIETDGSRIISIHPGAMVVRVHECRDAVYASERSRYYLSVDLKFREFDALREFGWCGYEKAEATRAAKDLANSITLTVNAINLTKASNMPGRDYLIQRQEQRLAWLTSKYNAEIVQ